MAKLSEQLVVEYLNRKGYFCIHGLRQGVNDSDILAIGKKNGSIEALHVEVQTSFRPQAHLSNKSAKRRSDAEVTSDMAAWLNKKFLSAKIQRIRKQLWPDTTWKFVFVHARLADERELKFLGKKGIELIGFREVLQGISVPAGKDGYTCAPGGDISEILRYCGETD
jgi:hypothetical protein